MRADEPLVEAGGVELLLAGATGRPGELVAGPVEHVEADVALLDALERLVDVALPDREPVQDGAILVLCRERKKQVIQDSCHVRNATCYVCK